MSDDYYDAEDKINRDVPAALALEVIALQDDLAIKMCMVRQHRLDGLREMPKCPQCKESVYRPRCSFELGEQCPRLDIVAAYGGMTALGRKFGHRK